MGCLQVVARGKSQDPQEDPVARLGWFVFFRKDINPTPCPLQPVPVAGRGEDGGVLCEKPLWTFGAGPGSA